MKNCKVVFLVLALCFAVERAEASRCCHEPDHGIPGTQGEQGGQGQAGPQGVFGPIAAPTFISLSYDGAFSVNPQSAIPFNSTPNAVGGAISYDSTTSEVLLVNSGVYFFQYGISGSPSNRQVAVQMNGGIVVEGSRLDTAASILQGISFLLEITMPMTTITLINNQPNNSGDTINISASSVGSQSAYLNIQRIY